jgi:hypothetical protein
LIDVEQPGDYRNAMMCSFKKLMAMCCINRLLCASCAVLILAGCQTLRDGGAPEPSFDIVADLRALDEEYRTATSIKSYYSIEEPAQKVTARNRFILGRIVQIDLRYIQFIRAMTADRQKLDAATDLATMTINLAGTLVGGARSKTNLAAAAAGLGGARSTIEKDFYYEKSIDALVGTMNARRKEVLVIILTGLNTTDVNQYPFELALTQLHEYYMAGTLNGALRFINTNSAEHEKVSDVQIQQLTVLPPSSRVITDRTLAVNEAIRNAGADVIATVTRAAGDNALAAADTTKQRLGLKTRLDQLISDRSKSVQEREDALADMLAVFAKAGWTK